MQMRPNYYAITAYSMSAIHTACIYFLFFLDKFDMATCMRACQALKHDAFFASKPTLQQHGQLRILGFSSEFD